MEGDDENAMMKTLEQRTLTLMTPLKALPTLVKTSAMATIFEFEHDYEFQDKTDTTHLHLHIHENTKQVTNEKGKHYVTSATCDRKATIPCRSNTAER